MFNTAHPTVRFEARCTLAEALARLSRRMTHMTFAENLTGRVSASQVRLKRHVPFVSRRTMAVFVGHFEDLNNHVVLVGTFKESAWTRMSTLLFSCLGAIFVFASSRSAATALSIFVLVFCFASIGNLISSKFDTIWRSDVSWISQQISEALNEEAV